MAKRRSASEGKVRQDTVQTSGHESAQGVMDGDDEHRSALNQAEFNARVARKAFELFERRGGDSGRDVEDWLEAERLVKEEIRQESRA
jgi:DUF2934 family protein